MAALCLYNIQITECKPGFKKACYLNKPGTWGQASNRFKKYYVDMYIDQ